MARLLALIVFVFIVAIQDCGRLAGVERGRCTRHKIYDFPRVSKCVLTEVVKLAKPWVSLAAANDINDADIL